jgi:hypothetical protein
MKKKIIGLFFAFLLFVGGGGFIGRGILNQRNQAEILQRDGVVTEGRIIGTESFKPTLYIYSFTVSGRVFEGKTSHPGHHYAERGDIVQVHYLPSNPSISNLDLVREINEDNQGLVFISIFLGVACLMFFGIFVVIRQGRT